MFIPILATMSQPAPLLARYLSRDNLALLDSGNAPASDEEAMARWNATAIGREAVQSDGGARPVADFGVVPGVWSVKLTGAQNLPVANPGGQVRTIVMIVRLGNVNAGLISRDTDAVTNKPAFAVRTTLEEDILLIEYSPPDEFLIDISDNLLLG